MNAIVENCQTITLLSPLGTIAYLSLRSWVLLSDELHLIESLSGGIFKHAVTTHQASRLLLLTATRDDDHVAAPCQHAFDAINYPVTVYSGLRSPMS